MSIIRKIYDTLCEHYDAQPVSKSWLNNPIEVIVGAILVQGSTWRVVSKILNLLRDRSLLTFHAIAEINESALSDLISSAGSRMKKAKRLKDIAQLFLNNGNGNINTFFARDIDQVRRELLKVNGISPGTVDNIILYAGKLPIYVVDPCTARIFLRHEIVPASASDADIQQLIHFELIPDDEPYGAKLFSEFQTLMVKIGQMFCTIPIPDCSRCPLAVLLPITGARNVNIQGERTIQSVSVILANKLKLKSNRPKIHELTSVQLQPLISVTKKQQSDIKKSKSQSQPKIISKNSNANVYTNANTSSSSSTNNAAEIKSNSYKTAADISDIDISQTAPKLDQTNQKPDIMLNLNDMEKRIVEQIGCEPVQIDLLVESTKLPIHIIRATIAILEMRKILRQVEGNRVERIG